MNKSLSDSVIYGGSVQEHRRNRGSYLTAGELITRISQRESLAGEFVHYPLVISPTYTYAHPSSQTFITDINGSVSR